jgi:hypothetical protein
MDETLDDAAFIEEQEEEDADVTDIIGSDIEKFLNLINSQRLGRGGFLDRSGAARHRSGRRLGPRA